ncbi:MAG: 5,10-methenyltetrahydrofolate synthetase [Bacillota bacterium]|jgi:5-formyltetrahydrofolate cyclo-ligase|nr:5,10-methenyltetrahydrofolate synthetase [Bacillota bacterium]
MEENRIQKNMQRQEAITARKALGPQIRKRFSQVISEQLIAEPAFAEARTILSYQSFGEEADPQQIDAAAVKAGKQVAYPLCYEKGIMAAAIPLVEDAWEEGRYGIKTPIESKSLILNPLEIDLVIVPCVAFEGSKRMRIGWGAGYYDRYLPQCKNAVTIAIAFEAQHIKGISYDSWDVPLDGVITEARRY